MNIELLNFCDILGVLHNVNSIQTNYLIYHSITKILHDSPATQMYVLFGNECDQMPSFPRIKWVALWHTFGFDPNWKTEIRVTLLTGPLIMC